MISHDIKAPLRTNLFYLHFLSQPHTEDERYNYHQKIKATTLRINEVVAHVMNLIQIGKEDIPKEEIELRPLMENIVRDLESSIEEAGGKVLIGDLPTLSGYPTEVRLLFQNLIANGLKFSRPGIPPIVKISATQSPKGWRILVQDNGIGLNPDHLNEALKATRRVHEDPDLYPGTGMGLTVCKTVCDRHGWELGVEAVDGGGAGFWVGTK